jgi:triosephosphate isomerase (TIM)
MKKYLIIGNWKNSPDTLAEAKKNLKIIKSKKFNIKKVEPVVCPSMVHLADLAKNYRGKVLSFCAQNFYVDDKKFHTGETSPAQLLDLGVKYVIIGHAERRQLGETNELIASKIRSAIDRGFTPVLCIGEEIRDSGGKYLKYLEEQLYKSLVNISKKDICKIVIAYEPLWAIGNNRSVEPEEIHVVNILIKKLLTSIYSRKEAFATKILYGGSVDVDNCSRILEGGDVDGLLIGRAGANPYSFVDILKKVENR